MMQKQYKDLILVIVHLEQDILCNSGEVFDESNKNDNYFQDIWD